MLIDSFISNSHSWSKPRASRTTNIKLEPHGAQDAWLIELFSLNWKNDESKKFDKILLFVFFETFSIPLTAGFVFYIS